MKTREEIIMGMCNTLQHNYGLDKSDDIGSGTTAEERKALWLQMAQLFDNCIAPYMTFKITDSRYLCGND
jgi:hypothetical protein